MYALPSHAHPFANTKVYEQHLGKFRFRITQIGVWPCDAKGKAITNRRKARRVPDDSFYQHHPELHRVFPRAYSETEVFQGKTMVHRHTTHGFYKFSGRSEVDEDDGSDSICNILTPPDIEDRFHSVIETEKANGKCVVMSGFQLSGERYLIGGSKGVHRVVRLGHILEDIEGMEDIGTTLLCDIFKAFSNQLTKTSGSNALWKRFAAGDSLCGEFCDGLHLVPLERGGSPDIKWFGILRNKNATELSQSLTGDVLGDLAWLRSIGLPTVTIHHHTRATFPSEKPRIRQGHGTEGSVLHYLDRDGHTIFVEKYKSTWYILLRVLRQAVMNYREKSSLKTELPARLHKTLLARNEWLGLPEEELILWYRLLCGFGRWLEEQSDLGPASLGFGESELGMGNVWRRYLEGNPEIQDDFSQRGPEIQQLRGVPFRSEYQTVPLEERILVLVQGLPGLGKTAVGDYITGFRPTPGVATLEQDRFNGNTEKCQAALREQLADPQLHTIFLMRNNANVKQYAAYASLAKRANWRVLAVMPSELTDGRDSQAAGHLFTVCQETILTRKGHPGFDALPPSRRKGVLKMFYNQFEPARPCGHVDFSDCVSWLQSRNSTVPVGHGWRRSIPDVAADLLAKAEQYRREDPHPTYVAAQLPKAFQEQLREEMGKLVNLELCLGKGYQIHLDHMTLMHSAQAIINPETWRRTLEYVGTELQIMVTALLICDHEAIVMMASPVTLDGKCASHYVESLVPHITAATAVGISPAKSSDFIRAHCSQDGDGLECTEVVCLQNPLTVTCMILGR